MRCTFAFIAFFFLAFPHLHAQDIEVLGSKPVQKNFYNQKSVLTFSSSELEGAEHFDTLIDDIPNLTIAGGTARARFIQIRGIGERSAYEGMPNASVGVLIDDIDYTGVSGILSTFGLDSLEVYKGPQTSSSGPSALAGMIRATSANAHINQGATLMLSRASFNTTQAAVLAALKQGKHALSITALKNKSDGFNKNTFLNREDTSSLDEESLRLKYLYKRANTELHFNAHSFDFNNGYDAFNFENSFTTTSDNPGMDNQQTTGASTKLIVDKGLARYQTIVSGQKTNTLYSYDEDWGNNPSWNSLAGWNKDYDYRIEFRKKIQTYFLEQTASFEWNQLYLSSGLYFKSYKENFSEVGYNGLTQRKNIIGEFKRDTFAAFLHADYLLSSKLSLFTGMRLESSSSNFFDNTSNQFSPNEDHLGGEVGLNYKKTSNHSLYLKLARGYKNGGINTSASVPQGRKEFGDESLMILELGNSFAPSSHLLSKTTLFLMYREDIQVKTSFQDNPSDPSSFTFFNDNAADAHSYGLEQDTRFQFSPFLNLAVSGSVLKTSYGNYNYGQRNLKNREFAYAPEFNLRVSPTLSFKNGPSIGVVFFFQDNFYLGNSHDQKAKSFQKVSLNLRYKLSFARLNLSWENIFDDKREIRGFFFGNRPPNFSNERFVQLGDPRRLKLQITFDLP